MSNGEVFEKTHDELDFEFLGNIRGKEWRVQTNVYGNGRTSIGREERYELWFDPTDNFHQYAILWSHERIIEMDEDMLRLKTIAVSILSDSGLHGSSLSEDLIHEMCRFGSAELHPVAAFIGE